MSSKTRDILNTLLAGGEIDAGMVAALKAVSEDQFFDAKSGKTQKAAEVVREYVSSFANAEGGFLVLGLSDSPPRKFEPFEYPGKETLTEWATNACKPLLAFPASSRPRLLAMRIEGVDVLFVFTARSEETLSPTIKNGILQYFLRAGSSTVAMSEVTVADLLYGRRSKPVLDLVIDRSCVTVQQERLIDDVPMVKVGFVFQVENLGFVDAEAVEVGVIGWSSMSHQDRQINRHLKLALKLRTPDPLRAFQSSLHFLHPVYRRTSKAADGSGERGVLRIPAFEADRTYGAGGFNIPLCKGKTTFTFAAFLRTGRGLPAWHSLTLEMEYFGPAKLSGSFVDPSDYNVLDVKVERLESETPVASIAFEPVYPLG